MIEAFLKGVAISLLLVFSVGPVIFTIIKQSVNHGRPGGFAFVSGVWLSDVIWIILSMGFSEVVKTLLHFKIPIGIGGCFFFNWNGGLLCLPEKNNSTKIAGTRCNSG